jgi:micrococcal nuclease
MYEYNAHVVKVYDGDTITVDIDLGLGVWLRGQKVRLAGINTPELRGDSREYGIASRDALRELILDKDVRIKTYKDKQGKYGRWIADVYFHNVFVNEWLLEEGYAEIYQ